MLFIFTVIALTLAFEYINGFHDTANSIATSVSTKVLTARQAVIMAAVFNLFGAFVGGSVATTIGKGLVDIAYITPQIIMCAILGAIIWNLITWMLGLPSSSSHALVGGLCGAAISASHGSLTSVYWVSGIWPKIILPMLISPVIGFVGGFIIMYILMFCFYKVTPRVINGVFGKLQLVSAAWMGFSHGTNDAQKVMGVIALILFTATQQHSFDSLPTWLSFLKTPNFTIAFWVKCLCGLVMACGTAAGGYKIIKTLGHKLVKLQTIHGFAAETSAAAVIQIASHWGIPLSTTHIISSCVMGVGATKRSGSVKWGVVNKMIVAWILTLPATMILAFGIEQLFVLFFE